MGRLSVGASNFAVYCGNGVYVGAVALDHQKSVVVEVAPVDGAMIVTRARAIDVLHSVRRLGVSAWIVRAGAGVAA